MQKEFSPLEMISLLTHATTLQKILWARVPNYLFYNNSNQALINYTQMFSETKAPVMLDDPPQINLMKSYYCEYGGAAFCLMYCARVLEAETSPKEFYNFMVQATPFSNFGYYSTPDPTYQEPLQALANLAELQASHLYNDTPFLQRALEKLQADVNNFDMNIEKMLVPPIPAPPHKYGCVVDSADNYVTYVLMLLRGPDGSEGEFIQNYTIKEGERFLSVSPPSNLVKAHWNGKEWEEAATPEEIAVYRRSHRY